MKPKRIIIACLMLLFLLIIVAVLNGWFPFDFEWQIKNDQKLIQEFVKEGCVRYFDGCNTCFNDGSQWSCTEMACSTSSEPKCLEYQK